MADREWYRCEVWDDEAAEFFVKKLARARVGSRPQYLKIQGITLATAKSRKDREVGRSLLRRVLDEYPDDFHAKHAAESLGSAYALDGLLAEAESAMRQAIGMCASSPIGYSGTTGVPELLLAEVLIRTGNRAAEATELLASVSDRVTETPIRSTKYKYVLACARVAEQMGDQSARELALQALELAGMTGPVFPRHPTFGVPTATADELSDLRRIAGLERSGGLKRRLLGR